MNDIDMTAGQIAVFVMSCDRTADVAAHFVAGFVKYWADCPFPVYVGTNSISGHLTNKKMLAVPVAASSWKTETLEQLRQLRQKSPGLSHCIVFLDDFILSRKVDTKRIVSLAAAAVEFDIAYLRLKHLEEGLFRRVYQFLQPKRILGNENVIRIRDSHPYYSSLQIAIWSIDHLEKMVSEAGNIWLFEHLQDPGQPHYTVLNTVFQYRHVVEKGAWETGAKKYCEKKIGWFSAGNRKMNSDSIISEIRLKFKKLIFFFFGYSIMSIKKRLK